MRIVFWLIKVFDLHMWNTGPDSEFSKTIEEHGILSVRLETPAFNNVEE